MLLLVVEVDDVVVVVVEVLCDALSFSPPLFFNVTCSRPEVCLVLLVPAEPLVRAVDPPAGDEEEEGADDSSFLLTSFEN